MKDYETVMQNKYARWQGVIDTFYDGRFFSLICAGLKLKKEMPFAMERLEGKNVITKVLSGTHTMDEDTWKEYNVYLDYASKNS